MFPVFDGFFGAAANTCHAVCTMLSPYRLSVIEANITQRTNIYTFPTGNTAIRCIKFPGMDENRIENRINDAAA